MPEQAISVTHLRKEYGSPLSPERRFVAVEDLTLSVPRGQVFGFLGPNGAGKTTTINMLLGNAYPTSGSGTLLGAPIGNMQTRRRLGFLPEKFQFHDFLTARSFSTCTGGFTGCRGSEGGSGLARLWRSWAWRRAGDLRFASFPRECSNGSGWPRRS